MSHLVPEQRVNKLGHVVTKHVLPAAASVNAAAAALPPAQVCSPAAPAPAAEPAEGLSAAVEAAQKDATAVFAAAIRGAAHMDDFEHMLVWMDEADYPAVRAFAVHKDLGFSRLQDVLYEVRGRYARGEDFADSDSFRAHVSLAASGWFDYCDVGGDPEREAIVRRIHESPADAASVVSYLRERRGDLDGLDEYLSEQSALRSGVL